MTTRNYATDYVVHADYTLGAQCGRGRAHDGVWSTVRSDVTCKRCLASLAKRDRAFQRKARKGIGRISLEHVYINAVRLVAARAGLVRAGDAARAIAREEGRAL